MNASNDVLITDTFCERSPILVLSAAVGLFHEYAVLKALGNKSPSVANGSSMDEMIQATKFDTALCIKKTDEISRLTHSSLLHGINDMPQ